MIEKEILVPNIGDFKDVEVIELLVEDGNSINKNDPLITIESDKSSVEIPSPYKGIVKNIKVKVGQKVSEGSPVLIIKTEDKKENDLVKKEKI